MKKAVIFAIIIVFFSGIAYAAPYDDVKPVMEALITTFHGLETGLNKAQDADYVINALNKFIEAVNRLKPKMGSLNQKYPELESGLQTDPPAELLSLTEALENAEAKCMITVQKITPKYGDDPEVRKALKDFEKAVRIP